MNWWQIALIILGGAIVVYIGGAFIFAAIQDHRYAKKYPNWKDRGGWKP